MLNVQLKQELQPLTGLLTGLVAGPMLSWGLLDVVSLFPAAPEWEEQRAGFAAPLESTQLMSIPSYGTLVLRNAATAEVLVLPMHIAFFQLGAQNHATSRTLVLQPGETLKVTDCYCIQQFQGGFLQEAQQRFICLPLGLRRAALEGRGWKGFERLWEAIEAYTRRFGISHGGHLDRLLRPNFARLLPYRHAFELQPGQIGAAYFLAGSLVGLELAPNRRCWAELMPILNIYCYGPEALLAERLQRKRPRQPLDLTELASLDDLQHRLLEARLRERSERLAQLARIATDDLLLQPVEVEVRGSLRTLTLAREQWLGQAVCSGSDVVYLSLFSGTVQA
jgi:hypothetical protein